MKTKLFFLGTLLLVAFVQKKEQDQLHFKSAEKYLRHINQQTNEQAKKYKLCSAEVLPIVFPECARFNQFENAFESVLLSTFNSTETKNADFSIGYFQMKPSFIENLEKEIYSNDDLKQVRQLFSYKTENPDSIRSKRLDRLYSEQWQIEYLCAFTKIMQLKYEKDSIEIPFVAYAAAAYNYGFTETSKEIVDWSQTKAFPYGKNKSTNNYSYAELALHFKKQFYGN